MFPLNFWGRWLKYLAVVTVHIDELFVLLLSFNGLSKRECDYWMVCIGYVKYIWNHWWITSSLCFPLILCNLNFLGRKRQPSFCNLIHAYFFIVWWQGKRGGDDRFDIYSLSPPPPSLLCNAIWFHSKPLRASNLHIYLQNQCCS